jgi:DNA-directed RNA polymerase subunit E'/Rpb7
LYTRVSLFPNQLNNDLLSYLKKNVIKKLENKCFKHYGFISKIYEINQPIGDGIIEPENLNSSVLYNVSFSCRLCIPLKNQHLICKVDKTNKMLTRLSNGPIRIIITNDRINKDNFTIVKTGIYRKENNKIVKPLLMGDHVKIKIESIKFNDKDNIIMCMGILESMATDKESVIFSTDEHNIDKDFVEFKNYTSNNK